MNASDSELLGQYTRHQAQDAFAEIVRRHLGLVYSAALRQVHSPQLAEEIAQSVFADLARQAGGLKPDTVLTAWLYAVTRRTAVDVIRQESRRRLREQIAVEMNLMNATATDWTQIEPLLDDAMAALDETDRSAVLLRYFENKSLREVGEALGTSDDAAQKRVSRAVERLREFFSKRSVTVGATGLVALVSANAVQSAPAGLAAAVSAAALAGTAVHTSTVIAAAKTIAMTTLQKTIIGTALVAAVGTGLFEAHQAAQQREQNQALQQQQATLADQLRQLQRERDDATNRLADLLAQNARLKSNVDENELLKLRGEVGFLRRQTNALGRLESENQSLLSQVAAQSDSTNQLSSEDQFILQQTHAENAMGTLMDAVKKYLTKNNGQYPVNFEQLAGDGDLVSTNFAGNLGLSNFEFAKDDLQDPQGGKVILTLRNPIRRPGAQSVIIWGCIDTNGLLHTVIMNTSSDQ